MWLQVSETPTALPHEREVRVAELSQGSQIFIWSIRQWLVSRRSLRCAGCDLSSTYIRLGCKPAIAHLDQFMRRIVYTPVRPLELRHPQFPTLSQDERTMLRVPQTVHRYAERKAAIGAASQLVSDNREDLLEFASRYVTALAASGLTLNNYRHLRLTWSRSA